MTPASILFMLVSGTALLLLPRGLAVLPLLLASAYTTRLPVADIGPASLSVLRLLVLLGIVRMLLRQERLANGINTVDWLVLVWAALFIGTSIFHTPDAWVIRIGTVMSEVGVYGLCRVFLQNDRDVRRVFMMLPILLLPLAALMLLEKYTSHNYFTWMGTSGIVDTREGHVRASGPFAHAILAGLAGAAAVPMAMTAWRTNRVAAMLGISSGLGILYACTSSGPLMMLAFTFMALMLWPLRGAMRAIRWTALASIILLDIVMKDPVYFLMARIDITGGSTGYYRSQLIRSAFAHLDEWWAVGTEVTRHWMMTGIYANSQHADIVNHFLAMGVSGGLPLLLTFVLVLVFAFRQLGRNVDSSQSPEGSFLVWTIGAMLFGLVMSFWAISPYDQSASFLYLVLATAGATRIFTKQPQGVLAPSWKRSRSASQHARDSGAAAPLSVRVSFRRNGLGRPSALEPTHLSAPGLTVLGRTRSRDVQ